MSRDYTAQDVYDRAVMGLLSPASNADPVKSAAAHVFCDALADALKDSAGKVKACFEIADATERAATLRALLAWFADGYLDEIRAPELRDRVRLAFDAMVTPVA